MTTENQSQEKKLDDSIQKQKEAAKKYLLGEIEAKDLTTTVAKELKN